jgi:hypothetical protein
MRANHWCQRTTLGPTFKAVYVEVFGTLPKRLTCIWKVTYLNLDWMVDCPEVFVFRGTAVLFIVYLTRLSVANVEWKDDMWMINWKECGRSGRGIFEVLSRHLPGRTEENHENLSQDSLSPGRDSGTVLWGIRFASHNLTWVCNCIK